MRSLVAASAIFDSLPQETPEWFDAAACRQRAIAWADQVVATQDKTGYWSIGYGAVYLADIAAGLAVFRVVEPYVDAERQRQYEAATRRFLDATQTDGMILANGAFGVGWPGSYIPRVRFRGLPRPYLVSTALEGIELSAWLYRRGGNVKDRDRAKAAFDYTLSQLQPDGSLTTGPRISGASESSLVSAAYVEEGWMAADVLLGDPEILARLRTELPRHVAWLLRLQKPDGSWDSGVQGEYARTPAILDFLIWYDQRFEARADVQLAIRRASALLIDPMRWGDTALFHRNYHHEVQRAFSARSLVALVRERFVL